jgi:hypothetical protein
MNRYLVITHTQERDSYDHHGRLVAEKGSVWVSHGVNIETGKTIILPEERWENFCHHCVYHGGEWYLK